MDDPWLLSADSCLLYLLGFSREYLQNTMLSLEEVPLNTHWVSPKLDVLKTTHIVHIQVPRCRFVQNTQPNTSGAEYAAGAITAAVPTQVFYLVQTRP